MSAFHTLGNLPRCSAVVPVPLSRGRQHATEGGYLSRASLPTDPIGTFTLTLTNVIVGSAIQIESQDGTTTLYNGTAASSSPVINLSAYAVGSALNSLRIKVRKGSASPYYQPYETLTAAFVGSQSIYIAQIPEQ